MKSHYEKKTNMLVIFCHSFKKQTLELKQFFINFQSSHQDLASGSEASTLALPSLSSIEAAKSDHLMSTLGFPSYIASTTASTSVTSRKFHEGI